MPKKYETSFGDYFKLPNPGLRAYFSHVESGSSDEIRTPFYSNLSPQQVVAKWSRKLSKLQLDYPSLYDFEIDLGEKVGPMSIQKPLSERMDDIDAYYDLISKDRVAVSERAILSACHEWSDVAGIRVRSQMHTVQQMKKSTNSGAPFFTKRRNVTDKTVPCDIVPFGQEVAMHMQSGVWKAAAVLGWRGQEGGPDYSDVKQRVVWMFPYAVNVAELQVYQPLIEALKHGSIKPHVPAWVGMDAVDHTITKMFDTKPSSDLVVCTDFSKFDQHFNDVMQDAARQGLEYLFTHEAVFEEWLNDVFPVKYMIPLAYNYGKIRRGPHGMASGSGGTNADETLAHRMLQHEAALSQGQRLNVYSQCLGDDGVLTYPGITVEDVVDAYSSHGLDMNPDKQYASPDDCVYLRRWYSKDYRIDGICRGVYSTNRALGRLCEQERFYDPAVWGPKMIALRQLSILENVKYHPLRDEFVDFCMKGDKYRLGLDIPGFLDDIEVIAQEAIDYMPDFLGYTRSLENVGQVSGGIGSWWIVNYLKSKA